MKTTSKLDVFDTGVLAVSGLGEMSGTASASPQTHVATIPPPAATQKPKRGRGRPYKMANTDDDPVVVTVMIQLRKSEYQAIRTQVAQEEDKADHKISVTRFISNLVQKQIKKGLPNV